MLVINTVGTSLLGNWKDLGTSYDDHHRTRLVSALRSISDTDRRIGAELTSIHSLREQLLRVAFARAAAQGMSEKIEALYRYLSGDEFRHRVEALVETFGAMQGQLAKERRAMEKLWNERARQIERLVTNTSAMYGAIRGAIGGQWPEIPALDLGALPEPEE